jgi:acyl dehydratase
MRRGPASQWTLCGKELSAPSVRHVAVVAPQATLFGKRWCEECRREQAMLVAASRVRLSKAARRLLFPAALMSAAGALAVFLKVWRKWKGGLHG